jgi:hypothetical protein
MVSEMMSMAVAYVRCRTTLRLSESSNFKLYGYAIVGERRPGELGHSRDDGNDK